jgi:hypothetical protein
MSEILDMSEISDIITFSVTLPACTGEKEMAGIIRFAGITVAVKDQDEALHWFTERLGFQKRVDRPGPGIRFLTVSPPKQPDLQVILASWFPAHVG